MTTDPGGAPTPGDLSGRVSLVTGGAVRLGRAVALRLARAGSDVAILHHRSEDAARELAAEIGALGRRVVTVRADLSEERELVRAFDEALAGLGRLDLLVNSAARYRRTPLRDLSAADLDAFHAVNLRAPILCIREAVRRFPGGVGAVVNIADIGGTTPWRGYVAYGAAKAGLIYATRSLALELAPRVRVNAVAPGPVLLPEGTADETREAIRAKVPLGRVGDAAEDVAEAVLYLATASYVTGHVLPVDGGMRFTDDGRRQV